MNVYRSSTTMQMDAKYKAVKQSRCMTRVITASGPRLTRRFRADVIRSPNP